MPLKPNITDAKFMITGAFNGCSLIVGVNNTSK